LSGGDFQNTTSPMRDATDNVIVERLGAMR